MHHFEQHKLKAIFFPVKFYFLICIGPDIEKIVCAAPRRALKSRKKLRYLKSDFFSSDLDPAQL